MTPPTQALAEWVCALDYDDLHSSGQSMVRRSVLDWIGCAALGARHPAVAVVEEFARAEGAAARARVIASTLVTSSPNAAWVQAVMGHIHDFDDSGAHPSSYLTPTVLALGDELGCPGREVLTAWAAGFEVSSRLASGLRPDRSWHTTPVYGTLGACAAAGRLLGLAPDRLRWAMGIAASAAGGLMGNFGTMTKALHPANAARAAIVAAKLAAAGYTANPDVLETSYGYVDCFGGPDSSLPAVTAGLGESVRIDIKPPAIKAWPTCSSNHATLTAIEHLLADHQVDSAEIVAVDHYGARPPGTGSLRFREVTDPLQAKFCLEYNIAAALVDGNVTLDSFSNERFARGDLQNFMTRIQRHLAPGAERLVVTLADGTLHEIAVTGRRTLSGAEVRAKFDTNIDRSGFALDAAAIAAEIETLAGRPDVRGLLGLLTAT
jgi:2-methylcitrate dehydratase PrpD